MRKIFLLSISIFLVVIAFTGICLGVIYLNRGNINDTPELNILTAESEPIPFESAQERSRYTAISTEPPEQQPVENRIDENTKIIYEYYYEADKTTVSLEEEPMYFLIGLTSREVSEVHEDWEIVSFSSDEVTLRKTIEAPEEQSYIVGVLNGYIAVFYEDGIRIKEITNTPINPLPNLEQERLTNGIHVNGDTQLIKMLESYGS